MWLKIRKDTAHFIPSEQPLIVRVTREGIAIWGAGLKFIYFQREIAERLEVKTTEEMVDFIGRFLEKFSERDFIDPSALAIEVLEEK